MPSSSSSTARPTTSTCSSRTRPPWRYRSSSTDSKAARHTPCAASSPAHVSAPACAATSGPPLLRRLLRRRTPVDHQAIHRRTRPTTLTGELRPPTNGMGSPRTKVRGLRPRIRSPSLDSWLEHRSVVRKCQLPSMIISISVEAVTFVASKADSVHTIRRLRRSELVKTDELVDKSGMGEP